MMKLSCQRKSGCRFLGGVVLLLIGTCPLRANDSSAAMAAGGLTLVKNQQVRMVSEVLRIAPRLVEVTYVFQNTESDDVTTLVAFPLPDLDQQTLNVHPVNLAFEGKANFVGFEVWSDGREIAPDVDVRAFDDRGRDVTAELRRLGVDPVNPSLDEVRHGAALRSQHLAEFEDKDILPIWKTRVSFHWQQTFPAGKQITIRHRYRPVYGSWYTPTDSRVSRVKTSSELGGPWCFDRGFVAAEQRLLDRESAANKNGSGGSDILYDNVQYVLKTGANWHGPIGRFELQIDKGRADLVSTCPVQGLTLQRVPYGFSGVAIDYTPTSDLDILFVSSRFLGKADGTDARTK